MLRRCASRWTAAVAVDAACGEVQWDSLRAQRSFRLDRVAASVGEGDIIVAMQDHSRGFSYLGFPGATRDDVADRLANIPLSAHFFHSVCGRERSACDFYADVDLDPSDDGEAILLRIVTHVEKTFTTHTKGKEPLMVSILSGSTPVKQSYHVHIRSPSCAFEDFGVVRRISESINDDVAHDAIDLGCYRDNGMLRCAYSRKAGVTEAGLQIPMLPYTPTNPILLALTAASRDLKVPELLSLSLVTRQPQQKLRLIKTTAKCVARGRVEAPTGGKFARGDAFLKESSKWARYHQAMRQIGRLPRSTAMQYATWVQVGLAMHSFNDDKRTLNDWIRYSSQAPEKFSIEACERKWREFGRRVDCYNWRRGYNFLTRTVWRSIGMSPPRLTPEKNSS